ncbi:Hypothetical predicted protein [Mytilus galloprovincialis]|uniref:Uncharacterized protein n=1 Tax=Mytilus galloprovincialis TaxID=29158 RepID=A0A8B6CTP8_MYTGA|nr:Hypothetical predicted protein [Mytilus galloprovincialis]
MKTSIEQGDNICNRYESLSTNRNPAEHMYELDSIPISHYQSLKQQEKFDEHTYESTEHALPMLNPSSQDITMATLQNFNTQSDRGDQPPKCDLRCKCCAVQMAFGLVCACNLTKESVGTQTDILVLNMTTEDYFKPKTTAFKLLQNQITSVLHTTKLSSTSDKTFEDSVSEVINFINDLPDTPRTREKVRTRFRKRMYNQKGYEKTKELAIATGGSVRKLQWKKAREAVIPPKQARASFKQRNISIVSSATTSPISSPAVSPVSTPSNSPQTSPTQPPMISPALSVSSHTPD